MPYTPNDETANKYKIPTLMSAITCVLLNGITAHATKAKVIVTIGAKIKITLLEHGPRDIPSYASKGAAGIDIEASIKEPIRIEPRGRILIPSGFKIELPINYEAQIRPRSGLAIKAIENFERN